MTRNGIAKVYIQRFSGNKLEPEEALISEACQALGIETAFFTTKNIHRRNLPLTERTLVAGSVRSVEGALKQLGVTPPGCDTYPAAILPFLKRRVYASTLGEVKSKVLMDTGFKAFIKPKDRHKTFTGLIVATESDFYRLNRLSLRTNVWVSDMVDFRSEFRVYVANATVLHVAHYDGSPEYRPDQDVIHAAVSALSTSTDFRLDAYALDVGVLSTGDTAIIEVNEGYGVGAYDGIAAMDYFSLISTRWAQLMNTIRR